MALISVVGAGDYEELARFNAGFGDGQAQGDQRDPAYWHDRFALWWERNPTFGPELPRGWIAREEGDGPAGRIVGFLGNVPGLFRSEGKDQVTFNATTWRVHPGHRNVSLKLYLAQIQAAAGRLMFNNTPNETVRKVLEYLRFGSLPSYRSGRVYLLPVRHRRVAAAYLRDRPQVPEPLRPLAALPLRAASLPARLQLWRVRGAQARPVERADQAFDDLWERTRDRYRHTSVRSSRRINWMCTGSARFRKHLVGHFEETGGRPLLRGYLMLGEARWRGLRVLESVDLWSEDPGPLSTRVLVAGALRTARDSGADLLALHDYCDTLTRDLRRLGLLLTAPDERRHFFGNGQPEPPAFSPAETYLTGLEGDLAM